MWADGEQPKKCEHKNTHRVMEYNCYPYGDNMKVTYCNACGMEVLAKTTNNKPDKVKR